MSLGRCNALGTGCVVVSPSIALVRLVLDTGGVVVSPSIALVRLVFRIGVVLTTVSLGGIAD